MPAIIVVIVTMQIFSLDYSVPTKQLRRCGCAVQAPERFAKLTWSNPGSEFPHLKVRTLFYDIALQDAIYDLIVDFVKY